LNGINLNGPSDPSIAERAANGKVSSACSFEPQDLRFSFFSKGQGKRMVRKNLKQLQDYQRIEAGTGKNGDKELNLTRGLTLFMQRLAKSFRVQQWPAYSLLVVHSRHY
jgi:hypothetical protein